MDAKVPKFPNDNEPGLTETLAIFPMMQRLTNEIIQIDPQTLVFHDRFIIDRTLNGIHNSGGIERRNLQ